MTVRTLAGSLLSASLVLVLCGPAAAEDTPAALAEQAQPPAPAADAGWDSVTLVCKGLYVVPNSQVAGVPTDTGQKTQFTLHLSYAGQYMDLKATEWPALQPAKDNPALVRSAKFTYDDDMVKAQFAPKGTDIRNALNSLGLSKVAGDYEEAITLNRKTGDFTYPNTSGRCEKVEVQENRF